MRQHLFDDSKVGIALLNPLTRGNINAYLFNSRICAAINDWLLDRWIDADPSGELRGSIRVNSEDPRGADAEVNRLAEHPKLIHVAVSLQSREPYGKPMFEPTWEAAASHDLPVVVSVNGGNGVDRVPTFAGYSSTCPECAALMPLNYFDLPEISCGIKHGMVHP